MPPAADSFDADIFALAEGLRPSLLRLGRKLRRESLDLGLSPTDLSLLAVIKANPGAGVCDLADQEQISRPTMSVHVKRLEAGGWLARLAPDNDDKRRFGLMVTPAAEAAIDAVRQLRTNWLAANLQQLPPGARAALRAAIAPLNQLAGERL